MKKYIKLLLLLCFSVPLFSKVIVYPDNSGYTGKVKKGVPHGEGMYFSADKDTIYSGKWNRGIKEGLGCLKILRKDHKYNWLYTYEGVWHNNVLDSGSLAITKSNVDIETSLTQVVLYQSNGANYYGKFSNLRPYTGFTTDIGMELSFMNELCTFNGEFREGKLYEGKIKNHPYFEGAIKNGLPHGEGMSLSVNRDTVYSGNWENGIKEGHGYLKIIQKRKDVNWLYLYDGVWHNNVLDSGSLVIMKSKAYMESSSPLAILNTYTGPRFSGTFKDFMPHNGKTIGEGYVWIDPMNANCHGIIKNGKLYDGQLNCSYYKGTLKDGKYYTGTFEYKSNDWSQYGRYEDGFFIGKYINNQYDKDSISSFSLDIDGRKDYYTGDCRYVDGSTYSGSFIKGIKRNGDGTYSGTGVLLTGEWLTNILKKGSGTADICGNEIKFDILCEDSTYTVSFQEDNLIDKSLSSLIVDDLCIENVTRAIRDRAKLIVKEIDENRSQYYHKNLEKIDFSGSFPFKVFDESLYRLYMAQGWQVSALSVAVGLTFTENLVYYFILPTIELDQIDSYMDGVKLDVLKKDYQKILIGKWSASGNKIFINGKYSGDYNPQNKTYTFADHPKMHLSSQPTNPKEKKELIELYDDLVKKYPRYSDIEGSIYTKNDTDEDSIFVVVDKMPEFPGGQQGLIKYLSENVKYPAIAQENGIQGRVIVQFVVGKDGSITNVDIAKSGGDASLDKEAIRVIKSMPNWKPGQQRGKAVRVKYTVPVNFRLQ